LLWLQLPPSFVHHRPFALTCSHKFELIYPGLSIVRKCSSTFEIAGCIELITLKSLLPSAMNASKRACLAAASASALSLASLLDELQQVDLFLHGILRQSNHPLDISHPCKFGSLVFFRYWLPIRP
jgi:hypothetical protein